MTFHRRRPSPTTILSIDDRFVESVNERVRRTSLSVARYFPLCRLRPICKIERTNTLLVSIFGSTQGEGMLGRILKIALPCSRSRWPVSPKPSLRVRLSQSASGRKSVPEPRKWVTASTRLWHATLWSVARPGQGRFARSWQSHGRQVQWTVACSRPAFDSSDLRTSRRQDGSAFHRKLPHRRQEPHQEQRHEDWRWRGAGRIDRRNRGRRKGCCHRSRGGRSGGNRSCCGNRKGRGSDPRRKNAHFHDEDGSDGEVIPHKEKGTRLLVPPSRGNAVGALPPEVRGCCLSPFLRSSGRSQAACFRYSSTSSACPSGFTL